MPLFFQTYPQLYSFTTHSTASQGGGGGGAVSVLQKRSSSAGGPPAQAAPTTPANTAKTQSQQRSPTCPPHPPSSNPITQNQRQGPLGALLRCARAPVEPGVQELWPRGLQSRNCALCAAEICTVISSAARVRGLRVARRPGPDRLAADGRADSMALRWASLKLACCCCSFG